MFIQVVKDSVFNGQRITTVQFTAPKFLDAEFEKHRVISSNSSSDRAIPFSKMVSNPFFLPGDVRRNQAGMQGYETLSPDELQEFLSTLEEIRSFTVSKLLKWSSIVHKQHLNRYLLGFSYQSKIATATDWENFFHLRTHPTADPAMQDLACGIKRVMEASVPVERSWHIPYVTDVEEDTLSLGTLAKVATARCARVSYNNHDGSMPSVEADLELFNQLATRPFTDKRGIFYDVEDPKHLSPLEHVAFFPSVEGRPTKYCGNFKGWNQFRKYVEYNLILE